MVSIYKKEWQVVYCSLCALCNVHSIYSIYNFYIWTEDKYIYYIYIKNFHGGQFLKKIMSLGTLYFWRRLITTSNLYFRQTIVKVICWKTHMACYSKQWKWIKSDLKNLGSFMLIGTHWVSFGFILCLSNLQRIIENHFSLSGLSRDHLGSLGLSVDYLGSYRSSTVLIEHLHRLIRDIPSSRGLRKSG